MLHKNLMADLAILPNQFYQFWEIFPRAGLEGFGKLFYVSTLINEILATRVRDWPGQWLFLDRPPASAALFD